MVTRPTDVDPDNALAEASASPTPRSASGRIPRQIRVVRRGEASPTEAGSTFALFAPLGAGDPQPRSREATPRGPPTAAASDVDEFMRGRCHSSTTTRHTEVQPVHSTDGQAHQADCVPQRAHGSVLRRPKTTEVNVRSTIRGSCGTPERSPVGKPTFDAVAHLGPKFECGRRSTLRPPEGRHDRGVAREIRAPPSGASEDAPISVANRAVEQSGYVESTGPDRHRSIDPPRRDTPPKPCSRHSFHSPSKGLQAIRAHILRVRRHPPEGRHRFDQKVRSKSRVVPAPVAASDYLERV